MRICLLILERGEGRERRGKKERERERETHRTAASYTCPIRDQTLSVGVCPALELNLQALGAWDEAPTNHSSHYFFDHFFSSACFLLLFWGCDDTNIRSFII